MPNLSGSSTQNQTVVQFNPTLQLNLTDLGCNSLSANSILYPRGGTNDLVVQVPQLLSSVAGLQTTTSSLGTSVSTLQANVSTLQTKTTSLTYNAGTQRLTVSPGSLVAPTLYTNWPSGTEVLVGQELLVQSQDIEDLLTRVTVIETSTIPTINGSISSLNGRVSSLETNAANKAVTDLFSIGGNQLTLTPNYALNASLYSVVRASSSRFPELLFSASYNSSGAGTYTRAGNGGGNTFSWRCIQQNTNYSDLAWQISTSAGAIGSSPTWATPHIHFTPTGISVSNMTVNTAATFNGSITQGAGQSASLGITSVQSLTASGSIVGVLSTAVQPSVTSLGTLSSLTVSGVSSLQGAVLNNGFLNIRTAGDTNHGMRYIGITSFASTLIDGPCLHGFAGGALGTIQGGEAIALKWTNSREIYNQFNVRLFDGIGYAYGYKILAIVTRTGSWSITPPASVFGSSGLVNQQLPGGLSGGWDSTNGWWVSPLTGFYRVSSYLRHTDSTSACGLRLVQRTLPSTDVNLIRLSDGVAWCAQDSGNRKTQSVSFLVNMVAGQALILTTANTVGLQESQMHVEFVSY
jgi:hypothetical protein